jgi:hypothetical protein
MVMKPIYEQRKIKANFRCTYFGKEKLRMEPVEPHHPLGDGRTTELLPINIFLNDEIRKNVGVSKVGDVKEFTLDVQILAGYGMGPMDS